MTIIMIDLDVLDCEKFIQLLYCTNTIIDH